MPRFIPLKRAVGYIERHSLEVFITPDGLVVKDDAGYFTGPHANHTALADDDAWFEELQAFPIASNNTVDITAIRHWIGGTIAHH
jgi:hypothetical protein